jgi:hypothetical protein
MVDVVGGRLVGELVGLGPEGGQSQLLQVVLE